MKIEENGNFQKSFSKELQTKFLCNFLGVGLGEGTRGDSHKYLQANETYLRISRAENNRILILPD
jgi:hypothetical protein